MTVPSCLPAGDYLVRNEQIALHSAQSSGGAQFYLSCGQLKVTGGGSKTPTDLVAFPGAYKATDPGLLLSICSCSLFLCRGPILLCFRSLETLCCGPWF